MTKKTSTPTTLPPQPSLSPGFITISFSNLVIICAVIVHRRSKRRQ
jgi:hypothetical protein